MVVVDLNGNHDDPCRISVLRTRGSFPLGPWIESGERPSDGAEFGPMAKALKVDPIELFTRFVSLMSHAGPGSD